MDVGNYYGVDISTEVLFAAQDTVVRQELTSKLPVIEECFAHIGES